MQGVFFRARAKDMAEKCEIRGWIKNTDNKKVEALVTGQTGNLNDFIEWCKAGPEEANVENVIVSPKPEMKFESFEVIR